MPIIHLVRTLTAGAVFTGIMLSVPAAGAASPFDATWKLNVITAGNAKGKRDLQCPGSQITLTVLDGRLSGSLERGPDAGIVDGYDRGARPVTGIIYSDGRVVADWSGIPMTGRATRNHLKLTWNGECGERIAMGSPF